MIAIQETWVDPADPDGMYAIEGFNLIRADRRENFGGGVALYIADISSYNVMPLDIDMAQAECLWVNITAGESTLTIGNIYRPPRADWEQFIVELDSAIRLAKQTNFRSDLLLVWDFNAKNSAWLASYTTDRLGDDLHCLCATHGLQQRVSFPTHIYRQAPSSCLNLIISNSQHRASISQLPLLGASDHVIVTGAITIPQPTTRDSTPRDNNNNNTYWLWTDERITSLCASLGNSPLDYTPTPHNPYPGNTFLNHWRSQLLQAANRHCRIT